jgi:hypothetical protein
VRTWACSISFTPADASGKIKMAYVSRRIRYGELVQGESRSGESIPLESRPD